MRAAFACSVISMDEKRAKREERHEQKVHAIMEEWGFKDRVRLHLQFRSVVIAFVCNPSMCITYFTTYLICIVFRSFYHTWVDYDPSAPNPKP